MGASDSQEVNPLRHDRTGAHSQRTLASGAQQGARRNAHSTEPVEADVSSLTHHRPSLSSVDLRFPDPVLPSSSTTTSPATLSSDAKADTSTTAHAAPSLNTSILTTPTNSTTTKRSSSAQESDAPDPDNKAQLKPDHIYAIPRSLRARYQFSRKLHDSLYGAVFSAYDRTTGEPLVIKLSSKRRISRLKFLESTHNEVTIMQYLQRNDASHPHVIRLLAVHEDEYMHCIVLERAKHGDLFDKLERYGAFGEDKTRWVIAQVLRGLKFLHDAGVAHLDMSLENVLVARNGVLKLCDFGVARRCDTDPLISNELAAPPPGSPLHATGSSVVSSPLASPSASSTSTSSSNSVSAAPSSTATSPSSAASSDTTDSKFAPSVTVEEVYSGGSLAHLPMAKSTSMPLLGTSSSSANSLKAAPTSTPVSPHSSLSPSPSGSRKQSPIPPNSPKPGKLSYMAPEIFNEQEFDGFAADMFSVGVMTFMLLFGVHPFDKPSAQDAGFSMISRGRLKEMLLVFNLKLSPLGTQFLSRLLCPEHLRLTVADALEHEWIAQAPSTAPGVVISESGTPLV